MFRMPEVPDCLEKRYLALDNLIEELTARRCLSNSDPSCSKQPDNAGIRLMCDFWNILKDDPDCNLKREVQQRMGLKMASTHSSFGPHLVTCYMSDKIQKDKANSCCNKSSESQPQSVPKQNSSTKGGCCASVRMSPNMGSDVLPLSKVLCSLKDAASFDKKCSERITDLMEAQKRLQEQIQHLEHREKEGAKMLKQADCMWSCMEEAYKKKVAESLEKQQILLKGLKAAEAEVAKWRKSKKELEFQLDNVNKCQQEIIETTNRKKNDIKGMKTEIEHLKKRVENGKKDADAASKSIKNRKQASDRIINGINNEIRNAQKTLEEERQHKAQKEKEGNGYIKDARNDLQKICRVLLQKKLENEDVKAERDALLLEIEMLKQTCDQCQDKCKKKQVSINDEILKVEKEIANFKVRCIRCHVCVDTSDVRKYCTDCPKCIEERDCITEEGQCTADPTDVCVCMSVKHKFMDNVFENMYTVLERQVKTRQGKCLAETVMQSLKKSRNGKIDDETRKILQEFILSVVKKNLNLTIIGGAVKTRCEMDPETYKQLALCLKQVKVTRPPKVDKGTISKKDPCTRWGGTSECNCPGGPKICVCTKKAPPPPHDPTPCPEDPEDKEENSKKEKNICPHKQNTPCGTECGTRGMDSLVGTEIAPWVPDPCKDKSCPFSKNMRAAQCVLGPERLSDLGNRKHNDIIPTMPNLGSFDKSFQENAHKSDTIQTEAVGKINKSEASTATIEKRLFIGNRIEPKQGFIKTNSSLEKNKRPSEKDILVRNLYQRDAGIMANCSCDTGNPLATMKLLIRNDNDNIVEYYTELVSTQSGELGIELDDNFFHLIENKANANPNSTVGVLVKDKEGYYTLDFNPKNITSDDLKIKIKKTSTGSMSIILNKTFIEAIKSHGKKSNSAQANDKSLSIEVIKKTDSLITSKKSVATASTQSKENNKGENDIRKRLEYFCVEGINSITLKIIGKNEKFKYVKAKVLRTPSKNIALEIKNTKIIEENVKNKDDVGLLHLSYSDTFLLDFRQSKINIPRNILIRKNLDRTLLIIIDQSYKQSVSGRHEYFQIKVRADNDNIINPPAVLKITTSDNYKVIVDKEFEQKYKELLKMFDEEDTLGTGVLSKTLSGEYIFTLNKNDRENNDCNAYLLKSISGNNLKVVVSGPAYNTIRNSFSKKTSKGSVSSSKLFDFLTRYSDNGINIDGKHHKLPKERSTSDSTLFDKSRIQNQENFIVKSGSLRKTNSGRYSIVLDKESKKTFVNTLGSYLKKNSNRLIPIKRTESGGISILLNNQENFNGQYGSLKISPSGNIYVIMDDKEKDLKKENISKSVHTVSQSASNKAVATHCNANPLDNCCSVSKCVCEELQNTKSDWFLSDLENDQEMLKKQSPSNCNLQNCPRKVDFEINKEESCSNKSSPHIVIKPCDNCSVRSKSSKSNSSKSKTVAKGKRNSEQCFYTFDSVCPFHKDRYDTVSNELIAISGLCNNSIHSGMPVETVETQELSDTKLSNTAKDNSEKSHEYDYFESMPPQLPSFLRDFTIS